MLRPGPPWIESIDLNRAPGQLTFGSIMAEGGLFYAGMFTVVAGLGLIIGIGIFSFFSLRNVTFKNKDNFRSNRFICLLKLEIIVIFTPKIKVFDPELTQSYDFWRENSNYQVILHYKILKKLKFTIFEPL